VCFLAVERNADVTDVNVTETLQAAAAASQTDDDFTTRELLYLVSLGYMIYHFLTQTIDIKHKNLLDKLLAKNILSAAEKQLIKEQQKVDSLLMMLREKSSDQFESFLTTLSETGQQSVADVVRQALYVVHQTGWNPLQYVHGETV